MEQPTYEQLVVLYRELFRAARSLSDRFFLRASKPMDMGLVSEINALRYILNIQEYDKDLHGFIYPEAEEL